MLAALSKHDTWLASQKQLHARFVISPSFTLPSIRDSVCSIRRHLFPQHSLFFNVNLDVTGTSEKPTVYFCVQGTIRFICNIVSLSQRLKQCTLRAGCLNPATLWIQPSSRFSFTRTMAYFSALLFLRRMSFRTSTTHTLRLNFVNQPFVDQTADVKRSDSFFNFFKLSRVKSHATWTALQNLRC